MRPLLIVVGIFYRHILKPILFSFPADDVHELFLRVGNFLGRYSVTRSLISVFDFTHGSLTQNVVGITFKKPLGLAAGFDYDADLIGITPSIGFGFSTIGTVTNGAYEGNPRPMLGRLPRSRSLIVNKGFKSRGIRSVIAKVHKSHKRAPLCVSIGGTNRKYESLDELISDIVEGFRYAQTEDSIDIFELNISCPNLTEVGSLGAAFESPQGLHALLQGLKALNITRPVFIKMHNESTSEETLALAAVAARYEFVRGLTIANLVKDRSNPAFDPDEIARAGKGNFSGKPTEKHATELIRDVYAVYKERFVIIGCGGIFTGEDAYAKIQAGATLVELITGMIYEGPQQIGVIQRELVACLRRDGFASIAEAVGSLHHDTKKSASL